MSIVVFAFSIFKNLGKAVTNQLKFEIVNRSR